MKQIFFNARFIFLVFSIVLLVGCTRDDSQPEVSRNYPPEAFSLVSAPSGATDVELRPSFIWESAIDSDSENVVYNLYVGKSNPPTTKIGEDIATTSFTLQEDLYFNTKYYWKVIAKDSDGNSTSSPVVYFTTREGSREEVIAGKWFITAWILYEDEEQTSLSECDKYSYFQFSNPEDESGTYVYYVKNNNGDCIEDVNTSFYYSFEGDDQLVMGFEDETYSYDILLLNERELVISLDDPEQILVLRKEL